MDLPFTLGERGRVVRITYGLDVDFADASAEVEITSLTGSKLLLVAGDGRLAIELPRTLVFTLDETLMAWVSAGAAVDAYLTRGPAVRSKIGAGRVKIAGPGQMMTYIPVSGPASLIMGPPGLLWRGAYIAGQTYQERDAVTAGNCLWYARRATASAPALAAQDWALLLDGSDVSSDRAAVELLAEQVAADALASDAAATSAEGSRSAAGVALSAAEQARDEAIARADAAEQARDQAVAQATAADSARLLAEQALDAALSQATAIEAANRDALAGSQAAAAAATPRSLNFAISANSGYAALIGC